MMSDILQSLQGDLAALVDEGLVKQSTLRDFDQRYRAQLDDMNGSKIKQIRAKHNISQGVLAMYMNMSPISVQKWERDQSKPKGAALKLLTMIDAHGLEIVM
jgi:putative transcriptional regulator